MTPRIYAIDPGYIKSTAIVYDPDSSAVTHIARDLPNEVMLGQLRNWPITPPTLFVIEDIVHMGMDVGREVFQTVRWSGRFEQVLRDGGWAVEYLSRNRVKRRICGTTIANDKNIRVALIDRFAASRSQAKGTKAKPGPLYGIAEHAWSALALAVTWTEEEAERPRRSAKEPR